MQAFPPTKHFPEQRLLQKKALELDESVAEAHVSLGHAYFSYDWNWKEAESEYKRGIELSPNYATGHHWLGWYWAMRGNHQEALLRIQQAQELDPLSMIINANAGLFRYYAHQYDDAILQYNKTLELDPNVGLVHYYLGMAYEQKGELSKALAAYQKAYTPTTQSPGILAAMGRIQGLLGNKKEAMGFEERLNGLARDRYISPCIIARIPLALGDKDRAFELLSKAYSDRDELLLWLKVDPRFDTIRNDARFAALMENVGFPN